MKTYRWGGMFGYDGKRRFILSFDESGYIAAWNEFTDEESADAFGDLMRKSGEYKKVRVVAKAKANRLAKIDDERRRREGLQ